MTEYKLRVWVGPVNVRELATRATDAGYRVTIVGTEHLHVWVKDLGDGWGAVSAEEKLIADLGLNPMREFSDLLETRD